MSVSRPSAVAIAAAAALSLPLVGVPMTPLSPALAAAAETTPPSIPVETFDGIESDVTDTSILVRWGASTDNPGGSGLKGYIVNYEDQNFNVPAGTTQYKLTGLGPESDYDVFVYAVDNDGNQSLPLYLAYTTRCAGCLPPTPAPATPTPTPIPTATPTPKPTATPTPTPTPIPTATPTPKPTATPIPTATPTPIPTATPKPTATPIPTATPTPIPTATPKPTATPIPTATPTPIPTATPKPTATPIPTATPTPIPTATPKPTATATPIPTATPKPTATATPIPTATPKPTATATPKPTATPIPTATPTGGPIANFKYSLSGYTRIKTLTSGWLPLTGSINAALDVTSGKFTADLALNDTKGNLTAIGFLPVSATVGFRTEGKTSGTLIDDQLKTNTLVTIQLKSVKVFGVTIGGGGTCQSSKASTIKLASSDSFDPTGTGGTIVGTYGIGNLVGCGAFTDLISTLTAGTGNTISAELTPIK